MIKGSKYLLNGKDISEKLFGNKIKFKNKDQAFAKLINQNNTISEHAWHTQLFNAMNPNTGERSSVNDNRNKYFNTKVITRTMQKALVIQYIKIKQKEAFKNNIFDINEYKIYLESQSQAASAEPKEGQINTCEFILKHLTDKYLKDITYNDGDVSFGKKYTTKMTLNKSASNLLQLQEVQLQEVQQPIEKEILQQAQQQEVQQLTEKEILQGVAEKIKQMNMDNAVDISNNEENKHERKDDTTYKWGRWGHDVIEYYKGEWKDGKKNGCGVWTTREYTYVGNWENDKMHGKGIVIHNDDTIRHHGEFQENFMVIGKFRYKIEGCAPTTS